MEDNATMIATATFAAKKIVFSSTLFGSMVIFQDPAYIIIALIGGFVSMASAHYDLSTLKAEKELKGEVCVKVMHLEMSKAFVIGLLFSLLSFMILLTSGESIVNKYMGQGFLVGILPSVWMIATIILATMAVDIFAWFYKKFKGKLNDNE